ncbi:vacuolar protein sorting-associated protein 8-like isoform X1, partial [Dinothrombium tinctorium]
FEASEDRENATLQNGDSLELVDSSSLNSFDSRAIFGNEYRCKSLSSLERNGPLLKGSLLKTLSSQLSSACSERVNAGKPSAIGLSLQFIVIGTSHGIALVFGYTQQIMKWCLKHKDQDVGAVSCLSINEDSSLLICGHSKGFVVLWNLSNGDLIKMVNDNHAPYTSVLHVKFTSDPHIAVLSDSGGSVFQMYVNKGKKDLDSQCIFSG